MAISKRNTFWVSTLLLFVPLAAAQQYRITDLGTFPGGAVSEGYAINTIGQVAGYSRFANFNAHGFFWTKRTGLVDLGSIPPASNFSVAEAINSFGDMAGYSDYNQYLAQHAVLWSAGTFRDLGTLPGGSQSQANGINDLGQIAGWSNGNGIEPHAVLWTKKGGAQDLGTLPGGYYSQGVAINLEGEVVGFSNATDGNWHGFLWNPSAGMQELPALSASDSSASGNGINNLGQVAGGSGSYAVLWHNNKNHTAENLGTLSGQGRSTAFAINDAGQVVGWSGFIAFIWDREHGMQDLNTLIPSNSGWTLSTANDINVRGQITGQGTINGQQHAFLLTPVSQ
jgi:probable HAF family extracellular repeat protein